MGYNCGQRKAGTEQSEILQFALAKGRKYH